MPVTGPEMWQQLSACWRKAPPSRGGFRDTTKVGIQQFPHGADQLRQATRFLKKPLARREAQARRP